MRKHWRELGAALGRARVPILTVAATYLISVLAGAVSVHAGNSFALAMGDRIVSGAVKKDPAAIAFHNGNRLTAASLDFSRNLILGAVPNTIGGLAIVLPYPVAAYRGWIGGIVSVDAHHHSRIGQPRTAFPFITVLILQLIPYSLAGGVGVYLGLAYLRRRQSEARFLGMPRQALLDVLRVYTLVIPLFAAASLVEFYAL